MMDCLFEIQAAYLELPLEEPVEPAVHRSQSRRLSRSQSWPDMA
jgi:hypothetical protein